MTPSVQVLSLVRGTGKQQQIPIWIFDDEIFGAPRLLFQSLVKANARGLKLEKQQLDLVHGCDGHRCRQQSPTIAGARIEYAPVDTPKIEARRVAPYLRIVGRAAVNEYH